VSRDGSGTYSLPQAAFVAGTTIESAKVNSDFSDIASALTASLAKDGQTVPTANLPMGGFKHTGVAVGTADTDYATLAQTTWFITAPHGRLTLTTAVPVLSANVSAAATVYYTPYIGNLVPIYDGTRFLLTTFTELSNVLANSSSGKAGPAAGAAAKNYDLFVWNDAGTMRLTRGGAWNADTSRSATTENDLTRVNGVLLNLNTITNGPAASRGTWVGTIRTDSGGATVTWHTGAVGTTANLGVWNMFNRVDVGGFVADPTDNWTYAGGVFRAADGASTMRVSFVTGLAEDFIEARYEAIGNPGTTGAGTCIVGVGLNSITTASGKKGFSGTANFACDLLATHRCQVLGFNYLQALEANLTVSVTFYGDNGSALIQSGLSYMGRF
jgi:hypothetical protein